MNLGDSSFESLQFDREIGKKEEKKMCGIVITSLAIPRNK
jgi:hypothetical protein